MECVIPRQDDQKEREQYLFKTGKLLSNNADFDNAMFFGIDGMVRSLDYGLRREDNKTYRRLCLHRKKLLFEKIVYLK